MNQPKLDIQKVSGAPKANCVCQVFTHRLILADSQVATLVSVFLIRTEDHEDLQKALSEVFELLVHKIDEGRIDEGLLSICTNASLKVAQFLEQEKVKSSYLATLFYKDAIYIVCHGDEVKLQVFEPESSQEIKFQKGSGRVKVGQLFLIATEKFLSIFDTAPLRSPANIDLEDIIDGLATDISAEDDQSEIAAAFVLVTSAGSVDLGKEQFLPEEAQNAADKDVIAKQEKEKEGADRNQESTLKIIRSKTAFALGKIFIHLKKLKRGDIKAVLGLRRNVALLATVLILALAVSGTVTIRNKFQKDKIARFNNYLSSASSKLDEGNAIADLNRSKARENFIEADEQIKLALEIFPKDSSAQKLSGEINSKLKETEQQNQLELSTFAEFADDVTSLNLDKNNLSVVTKASVVKINLADKSKATTNIEKTLKLGTVLANDGYVYSGSDLFKIDLAAGAEKELLKKDGAQDMAVFIGNLYLLTGDGIAKFVPVQSGFVEVANYLSVGFSAASSSRMAIDGSIWITKGSGILNFLQAKPQDFQISGLTSQVGEFGQIYTSSGIDNLYVVDIKNSALLVISKEGVYLKAYQSSEFAKAQDLVIDNEEKKLYLAVGDKVLEADL